MDAVDHFAANRDLSALNADSDVHRLLNLLDGNAKDFREELNDFFPSFIRVPNLPIGLD